MTPVFTRRCYPDPVADAYTPEQLAMLARQIAYFSSDEHIYREVEPWLDATPEQRLAEVAAMCAVASEFLERLDDATAARLRELDRLPDDTIAILMELRRACR